MTYKQGSKKLPSVHPGQVDFPAREATFHCHLPIGQGLKSTKTCPWQAKLRAASPKVASHADVLRLVTSSSPRGEELMTSLRTSAWEASPKGKLEFICFFEP